MIKILIGFVLGVLFIKGASEISNYRVTVNYETCVEQVMNQPGYEDSDLSAYRQCRHHFELTKLESVILYRPNFWERLRG